MTIAPERLAFALKNLPAEEWAKFERLASAFLVAEFDELRTRASMAGDGGRDAELYLPNLKPSVSMQYSVRRDWKRKIEETRSRIADTAPDTKILIYVTNQTIGADADDTKIELLSKGISLDVRDFGWFIDRIHTNSARSEAAIEFSRSVIDPITERAGLEAKSRPLLTNAEADTALLFLEMQILDGQKEYGLTKSSFDALVRAALRETNTTNRMARGDIHAAVSGFLPGHDASVVNAQVDGALSRLQKGPVRFRSDGDEFHLREEESERLRNVASDVRLRRADFESDIYNEIYAVKHDIDPSIATNLSKTARECVEQYLLKKGEQFAKVVTSERAISVDSLSIKDTIASKVGSGNASLSAEDVSLLEQVVKAVLSSPGRKTDQYLSLISDSYTLFAFLQATPDVQKVSQKMFGKADLWMDTSVILPLLAEIADPESDRKFTKILRDAKSLGMKIHVTHGVVEEIERNINICRVFINKSDWKGRAPYLYSRFVFAGRKDAAFAGWLENFAGHEDPEEDIAEYLWQNHGIEVDEVGPFDRVSPELIQNIEESWRQSRAAAAAERFDMIGHRMAAHDSENYLNVINARVGQVGKSQFGYTTWWVTLHGGAREILEKIPTELRHEVKGSPILSIDFLVRYLAMGPRRDQISSSGMSAVGPIYVGDVLESLPLDLITAARSIRAQHSHFPEHVIRRRIREHLNTERSRRGTMDAAGMGSFADLARRIY